MPRLVLLLAIAAVLFILIRRAQSMPPHKRRGEFIKIGLGGAVILVIGLTLAGKMHWVGAALTGLLVALRQLAPTLIRLFPVLAGHLKSGGAKAAGSGQTSTVSTDIIRMDLDHDSGALSGEVLKGPYREWRLRDMNRAQLDDLMAFCIAEDEESAQLLDGYMSQRFGEDYASGSQQQDGQQAADGSMTEREALEILGLEEGASKEDIITAHRSLMQKLHPDRGGNDYLAAKINQAKDFLTS